jgi:hypothetical protein
LHLALEKGYTVFFPAGRQARNGEDQIAKRRACTFFLRVKEGNGKDLARRKSKRKHLFVRERNNQGRRIQGISVRTCAQNLKKN